MFYAFARKYFPLALTVAAVACSAIAVGVVPVASLALIVLSCTVLGRRLFGGQNWAVLFVAGLAVWALAIALLAPAPVHYAAVYVALLAGVIAFSWQDTMDVLRALTANLRRSSAFDWITYAAFSVLGIPFDCASIRGDRNRRSARMV